MNRTSHNDLQVARGTASSGAAPLRGPVVNRTHRVIRERARVIEERRSRVRSLLLPLIICSVLLVLTGIAIWTGLYQYQAVESVSEDVAALADTSNHIVVVILWFVPVSLAVLFTVWMRRARGREDETL